MEFGGAALFASGPFEAIDGPVGKREDGTGTLVAIAAEVVVRGELRAADGAGVDALRAAARRRSEPRRKEAVMDFGGAALFASGPFEVIDGPIGKREDGAGTLVAIAPEVVVRGELRAADGAGIDALRAAVRTRVGTTAALVGERGRAYGAAELLRYSERGVRAAGGVWSCGYETVFRL